MPNSPVIDLGSIAAALQLPAERVEAVVALLDSGNTVPFITRFRKDQTGALDDEQVRAVQQRVVKARQLAERKQSILRSIESQSRLTPELAAAIGGAETTKQLEDLYLPYKRKKQALATTARQRGLEPLATEILNADPACADLDARANDFVSDDRKVTSAADALMGAGYILAELFSERADLRELLRSTMERSGRIVTVAAMPEVNKPAGTSSAAPAPSAGNAPSSGSSSAAEDNSEGAPDEAGETDEPAAADDPPEVVAEVEDIVAESETTVEPSPTAEVQSEPAPAEAAAAVATAESPAVESPSAHASAPPPVSAKAAKAAQRSEARKQKKLDRQKERQAWIQRAFRDYFHYSEALGKIPPHRVLAINRGERAGALKVKLEYDLQALLQAAEALLLKADHPHVEFLRGCARDAIVRLVLPSLEREVRRELTDHAEAQAVKVFVHNLRKLLLQPPIRDRRILAIDPGFKSGCKLAALDEFGSLLEHGLVNIVGKEDRQAEARAKIVELIDKHQLNTIAIGNGSACRQAEQFVSDLLAGDLAGRNVTYTIVNEAGTGVYSTSQMGRSEFPNYDAVLRGAISIGRRLQDPLSELVKIDPANIGVGMYQHDMKAHHLRDSLDAVVSSCVNFVGVDLNTASPALLRYVSGLNQLTAQRIFEQRTANGPFKTREQLKQVTGIGDAVFVQSAGFLKIVGGDQPLDSTWIHPESYGAAEAVLGKLGATPADLLDKERAAQLAQRIGELSIETLAGELGLGVLTLRDIVAQLVRPGRDPRESLPPPIFKKGVLKIDDLAPNMELAGTVLNVVDFGAFVDIGLKDSGLVHISQLADRYIQSPHEVVSVGDVVNVWVLEVDKQRRRVSLTMIAPGTRRAPPARGKGHEGTETGESRPPRQQAPRGERRPAAAAGQTGSAPASRPPRKFDFVKSRPPARQKKGSFTSKPQAKPVVPLTEEMKLGKAPMRTFGDLAQFLNLKKKPDDDEPPPAKE